MPRDVPTTDVDCVASVQAAAAVERRHHRAEAAQQRAEALARAESGVGLAEGREETALVGEGQARGGRHVLSKKERLLLRRQALHMESSAVFSVGESRAG